MEFSGRLAAFPVGHLLQWASHERRTGALVMRKSHREKLVYFRDGEVVGCRSDDPSEYYGQHLLLHGYLDEESLVKALAHCKKKGIRLGLAARELGMLTPKVIQETLRTHIEDCVCDLFLWQEGVFYFRTEMSADEELLPQPIITLGLIMEGSRWMDEYDRIRRVFIHDNVVLCAGPQWPGEHLSVTQERVAAVLEARGGSASLAELYKEVHGSYFRFLEAALDLTVREVLDVESIGETGEADPEEPRLDEMLLEQAAEEQDVFSRQLLSVPLDLLERFYPVWVKEPSKSELARVPKRVRDFYQSFDGNTTLHELFAEDKALFSRELDLLLLHMRRGHVALLPIALKALEAADDRQLSPFARRKFWRKIFAPPETKAVKKKGRAVKR